MKRALLICCGVAGALLLLAGVLAVRSQAPPRSATFFASGSSWSAGPDGLVAMYQLFEAVGMDASRLLSPRYDVVPATTAIWILGEVTPLGRLDTRLLLSFVEGGGTVVAVPSAAAHLLEAAGRAHGAAPVHAHGALSTVFDLALEPGSDGAVTLHGADPPDDTYADAASENGEQIPVVAAWKVRGGRIVSLGVALLAGNAGIGRAENGTFLVHLAAELAATHAFDEVHAGFGGRDGLDVIVEAPYRWAAAALCGALAVALAAVGLRRAPAVPRPRVRRRATGDHVDAVAHLWRRTGDATLPLSPLLRAFSERARRRLGDAAASAAPDDPFLTWIGGVRPDLDAHARKLWSRAAALRESGPRAQATQVRQVVWQLIRLEKEALQW